MSENCIDVEHSCFQFFACSVMSACSLDFALDGCGQGWTDFVDVCNVLDTDASQNNACRTKDVRFQNSLTRPTQQLRILRYHRNG